MSVASAFRDERELTSRERCIYVPERCTYVPEAAPTSPEGDGNVPGYDVDVREAGRADCGDIHLM